MRGEPSHLAALVAWYLDAARERIPVRIHSRDTADDGSPDWHAQFRAYLMAHPSATDREGYVRDPLAHWLWVMKSEGRENRVMAEFLYRLGCLQGDWLAAARAITPLTDDGEVMAKAFAVAALQRLWRRMQTEPRKFIHPKSDAQHAAEEAA